MRHSGGLSELHWGVPRASCPTVLSALTVKPDVAPNVQGRRGRTTGLASLVLAAVGLAIVWAWPDRLPGQTFDRVGVQFNARRRVSVPQDEDYAIIVVQFFHHNQIASDGRNVVVEGYEKGNFLGPTIFSGVTPEMDIYTHEIFGPVM